MAIEPLFTRQSSVIRRPSRRAAPSAERPDHALLAHPFVLAGDPMPVRGMPTAELGNPSPGLRQQVSWGVSAGSRGARLSVLPSIRGAALGFAAGDRLSSALAPTAPTLLRALQLVGTIRAR